MDQGARPAPRHGRGLSHFPFRGRPPGLFGARPGGVAFRGGSGGGAAGPGSSLRASHLSGLLSRASARIRLTVSSSSSAPPDAGLSLR
jgi:hypothetical protein